MSEEKKFMLTSEQFQVNAGILKKRLLNFFGENPLVLETEEETDENTSCHLLGFDSEEKGTSFSDHAHVDLETYQKFQISQRTTGGL